MLFLSDDAWRQIGNAANIHNHHTHSLIRKQFGVTLFDPRRMDYLLRSLD
jgi:hypothetical protein